jgi:hypothetical protein
VDECHRSIYNLWKGVLDYFDAFQIGLTATPSEHTLGYFNQNLVSSYTHEQALLDKVNILFSTVRTYLKKVARVERDYPNPVASTGFTVIRAGEGVSPQFLFSQVLLHRAGRRNASRRPDRPTRGGGDRGRCGESCENPVILRMTSRLGS